MPAPRDPQPGARAATVHLDNSRWQDNGGCGPFRGIPRQVRNGVPWKPYVRGARRHWWAERTRQAIEREA